MWIGNKMPRVTALGHKLLLTNACNFYYLILSHYKKASMARDLRWGPLARAHTRNIAGWSDLTATEAISAMCYGCKGGYADGKND